MKDIRAMERDWTVRLNAVGIDAEYSGMYLTDVIENLVFNIEKLKQSVNAPCVETIKENII